MSASRAASTASVISAGTGASLKAPLPSVLKTNAFFDTRSTTPRNAFSSPIGSWIGITDRLHDSRSEARVRSRLARSRSRRLTAIRRGRVCSSAAAQTFSVCTMTPATASTTTSAASATLSAASASARKLPTPGVSIRLIFCRFHSA